MGRERVLDLLVKEQVTCEDTSGNAGRVGNQATRYGVAGFADTDRSEIQRRKVKRCFGTTSEDRRQISNEGINAMYLGYSNHHGSGTLPA